MSIEKIGRTGLFIIFILMIVLGAKMAIRVGNPYLRKVVPSLADVLQGI